MTDLLLAALAFGQGGFSVVPCRNDSTKAPAGAWTRYMAEPATGDQLVDWFALGAFDGFGLVCGAVSGNLELLEWEGRAIREGMLEAWLQTMSDHGFGPLALRLFTGYLEQTPSGGLHILYRVDGDPARNTKLARRLSTPEELAEQPDALVQTLMETRGEGGYVVVAPSGGRASAYPGKVWHLINGGPDTVPVLTVAERDALHDITRLLDAMPEPVTTTVSSGQGKATTPDVGARPGDDYNARASWDDILRPAGWTPLRRAPGGAVLWQRPGKTGDGISASTGANEADNLYVFSSSTVFDTEVPISKFEAYRVLHNLDHASAARALRDAGYGGERPPLPPAHRDDYASLVGLVGPAAILAAAMQRDVGQLADQAGVPRSLLQPPPVSVATPTVGRRQVKTSGREWHQLIDDALEALAASNADHDQPRIYTDGATLTRVLEVDGRLIVQPMTKDSLGWYVADSAYYWRFDERTKSNQVSHPTERLVKEVLKREVWAFPLLERIVYTPIFTADGTLVDTPGYVADARVIYAPLDGVVPDPVPADPSPIDVANARALLLDDLIGEFPFASDGDKATAVALMLLPFVRSMIDGATPLHCVEAPTAGTGKGLLVDALLTAAIGSVVPNQPEASSTEEWRKSLGAVLSTAPVVVKYDNINEHVDSSALALALTSTRYGSRRLGTSESMDLPVRCAWVMTANNPTFSSEMARRVVRCRLDAHMEKPSEGRTFTHASLLTWATQRRAELIHACCVLVQAWVVAGRPDGVARKASYEDWSRVMGGLLAFHDVTGFLSQETRAAVEGDTESHAWAAFVDLWAVTEMSAGAMVQGFSAAQLLTLADGAEIDLGLGSGNDRSRMIAMGIKLKKQKDRRFGRYKITQDQKTRGGRPVWILDSVELPAF